MQLDNVHNMISKLSKNKISFIRSLERKKERTENNSFLAEGPKVVKDLLNAYHCDYIAATQEWLHENPNISADEVCCVSAEDLSRASLMKTPQQVLAVFRQQMESVDMEIPRHSLCLALDGVQNPGNLGTIIRLADWFGIEHIFCSLDTVDIYNPKVVQATMGAMAHVHTHYLSLVEFIKHFSNEVPVYGTLLEGQNIFHEKLTSNGIIVMGNEGKGISREIEGLINHSLYIPNYPLGRATTDSLNVAIATAIVCAEFRRQISY